jgi:RNA polymerase primary sigma factor
MIQVQRSVVTNPAKEGLVSITSSSSDLGDYLRKVNSIKTLDAKEEKELAIKAKNGDELAKKELVNANLKLVMTIARKAIHVSKLPMVDLIQEGNLGLMVAAEKFNPELGYRFSTYATWWIKQAMFKAISEQSHSFKIPVYIQETLSKYSKVKAEMENTSCRIRGC